MNRIAIMQPYIFPYLGYYQLVYSVDKFVLYDNLNYIYQGWVNRNRLLQINRLPFYFIIPVQNNNLTKTKIKDVKVANNFWRKKLLNSIRINYSRSDYFDEIFPVLQKVINCNSDYLSEINKQSIIEISNLLNIKTEIIGCESFNIIEERLNNNKKLSDEFKELKLTDFSAKIVRGVMICKTLKAETFINPMSGGVKLYPKNEFIRNKINILYLKLKDIRYRQNADIFYSNLSIIDVLLNCGKSKTKKLLREYELF